MIFFTTNFPKKDHLNFFEISSTIYKMMMLLYHFFVLFYGWFIGRYLLGFLSLCDSDWACLSWVQGKKVTACYGSFHCVLSDEATRTRNHKNDQREFLKKVSGIQHKAFAGSRKVNRSLYTVFLKKIHNMNWESLGELVWSERTP